MEYRAALFDIDGTLLQKAASGPTLKQLAYTRAIEQVYGIPGLNYMDFPIFGLTDRGILRLLLSRSGVNDTVIREKEHHFWSIFFNCLDDLENQNPRTPYQALPGARQLLLRLQSQPEWRLGLATGNMERIAWDKLQAAGLDPFFDFGGFGEDGVDRSVIVHAALKRSEGSRQGVLIGDTPTDIQAGLAAGCRVIAVATGRFSEDQLKETATESVLIVRDLLSVSRIISFMETDGQTS